MEGMNPIFVSIAVGVAILAVSFARYYLKWKRANEKLGRLADPILEAVNRDGLTTLHAFNICEAIRRVKRETGENDLTYGIEFTLTDGRQGTVTFTG